MLGSHVCAETGSLAETVAPDPFTTLSNSPRNPPACPPSLELQMNVATLCAGPKAPEIKLKSL